MFLRPRDRVAAGFVLVAMTALCLSFWIAIPAAVLWALSQATDSFATHVVLGVLLVPAAMVAFSPLLLWLNRLYLRVTGVLARLEADRLASADAEDADGADAAWHRRLTGPLEPMLIATLAIAVTAFAIWFLLGDPPARVARAGP